MNILLDLDMQSKLFEFELNKLSSNQKLSLFFIKWIQFESTQTFEFELILIEFKIKLFWIKFKT